MKILQNRLRFSVGVQYKPLTVMREQVGARDTRVLRVGDELSDTGNELLKHWRHTGGSQPKITW